MLLSRRAFVALFSLAAVVSLSSAAHAQKKPLTQADWDRWQSIAGATLSADGKWVAYTQNPRVGDGDFIVHSTSTNAEYHVNVGYTNRENNTPGGERGRGAANGRARRQIYARARARSHRRARPRGDAARLSGTAHWRESPASGMNIEADLRVQGKIILRDRPEVRAELARIVQMWSGLLEAHGGPMLFGEFGIADAYFAPVGVRIKTYGLPVPGEITAYIARVQQLPGVKAWIDDALVEKRFVVVDEPYRIEG